MEYFKQAIALRHPYAKAWRDRTGGKVLGYLCCYMPEEIAYAAGVLPVRIVPGNEPQDLSNLYMVSFFCPFSRDCLGEGLKGSYDYLDGISMGHTCIQIDQTYDSWRMYLPRTFEHYIPVPGTGEAPILKPFFTAELGDFQTAVEGWTERAISEADLDRAIEVYNQHRRLLHRLYRLRRDDPPAISGADAFEVVLSSMFTDKDEHNLWLAELLDGLPNPENRPSPGPRVMMVGGETHDPELLRLIEEQGANIVIDDLCMGSRYFWNPVVPEEDRLSAIAGRYMGKPACPVKDVSNAGGRTRHRHLMELARDWEVQGVFIVNQKFCHPQELDMPSLDRLFRENGLPTCTIELDSTLPRGQIRTRAQAFLEMLQLEGV